MTGELEYALPDTLDEALDFLWEHGTDTKPVAGGTDVMVDLRSGKLQARRLLDLSRLSVLRGVAMTPDGLSIGACATLAEIRSSEAVARFAPALQRAAVSFAGKQIRNVATIGGNVGNASPCADTVPPMIVQDAVAVLRNKNGERRVPVEDLFAGPYRSAVRAEELILRFILQPAEGRFCDFQKIGRRKALAIARMSMAVSADKDGDGVIRFIRLSLGSSTPTPRRMREAEDLLLGKRPDEALLAEGGRLMAEKMIEISGRRPSTVYKEKAVQGLFRRLLFPMV